ncbi:MAG TPA: heavy metal translocating P-type ATPase [Candidatus Blautia pullicola]|jgi:heavy metal translocating P-type ATPase|uniref:Cd(2+)-exporting ATPase n=1 Tax=Candidatus Blautia pullicola TaxID=2838498 RepID=A0A9D2FP66_9FIRM|nr:heavy metal translocating P-type ATPase [Candidatus Blautia pullicola]
MRIRILHEIRGRIRFATDKNKLSFAEADMLLYYMNSLDGVSSSKVYERTGHGVVCYRGSRAELLKALAAFSFEDEEWKKQVPDNTGRELMNLYKEKLVAKLAVHALCKVFLPAPLAKLKALVQSWHFLKEGLRCVRHRRLEVPVLDAAAITMSLIRGDIDTAGSIMLLLGVGEILEEWTHKKSVSDLARSMSLNVEKIWVKQGDTEILTELGEVKENDLISVHMGNMIPLDGAVVSGEAMVNQSSLTGEAVPVKKEEGAYVYAGTVVEEGELLICVKQSAGSTRYEKIVAMIEDSERLKSSLEGKAAHLADSLVPFSFGGTLLTYALTRNITKALSILMVDFSCALKLSMPIAVLTAMRECQEHCITVKGGKFLEAVAEAETVVFDKTGTFTKAQPTVARVIPFGGRNREDMLRLAACLEEHFPHSIANAVVAQAKKEGLAHEEMHSKVEYVVAHGISSQVNQEKVVIGSYHFVFEDEKCRIPHGEEEQFESLPGEYSHLYLAVSQELAAVICIEDPLREEARDIVASLKAEGIKKVVMMTGDSLRTAQAIAQKTGVDAFYAEVLPEDKASFVEKEKALGRKVIMIGDGINDSPALSAANAGIAISGGAQLAREIADITISGENLDQLVTLKKISSLLMKRINRNYRFVIGFNMGLILLGLWGVLAPGTSALLHNMSTLGITLESMTNMLDKEIRREK